MFGREREESFQLDSRFRGNDWAKRNDWMKESDKENENNKFEIKSEKLGAYFKNYSVIKFKIPAILAVKRKSGVPYG
ncbi:MAG: hypothetical protein OXJ52_06690 [Oligoflexia bacterium]|nr:hypothetical protein [Oligoflexia bacterium]